MRNKDFGRRDLNNYYVNPSNNVAIIKESTVIKDTRINKQRTASYNGGPAKAEVEKLGGRPVTAVPIKESTKPGQNLSNNQLQIYRPQVQKTSYNERKPVPTKVANLKDVKPPAQRTGATPAQKVNQTDQHHPLPPVRTVHPEKQQQPQQHTVQPAKQQTQPQHTAQPAKQQQTQPQHTVQPAKQQQPQQQQHNAQPAKQQQPQQQQHNAQPAKQQQQQHNTPPPKQQQSQPQHENPPQPKEENPPH
ncbi:MAG: hypothetical protein ABSD71_10130 [Bacteroidales bacterium]